jgi:hypothetical protein
MFPSQSPIPLTYETIISNKQPHINVYNTFSQLRSQWHCQFPLHSKEIKNHKWFRVCMVHVILKSLCYGTIKIVHACPSKIIVVVIKRQVCSKDSIKILFYFHHQYPTHWPINLVWRSILISSDFNPLPITLAGDRTVVLFTKFSTYHYWINQRLVDSIIRYLI